VSRDTSFSYSFLVLPAAERRAVLAVWDFCRAVDDAVDEEPVAARAAERVEEWRAEVARVFEGRPPATGQGRQLRGVVEQFDLSRAPFDALVEGVEMDLHRTRYETYDELIEYSRRVASAVGLMCVEIFGCREPEAREYAVELGLALQLTNIVRDVKEDLARGRVYLPSADLRRFGCTEADLAAGVVTGEVRRLLEFECARAREHYRRAAAALPMSSVRKLVAAEIMGGIYFEILQRIERRGYDVFSQRVRVPKPARAIIALTIWMRSRVGLAGLRLGPASRA
jgi:15-cis-phytoene synthase